MATALLTIHIIVALLLIGVVLMQRGQGADIGASFGGGSSQTLFGSGGSGSFLGKATGILATIFMTTSLTLAFFSQQDAGSVLMKNAPVGMEQQAPDAGHQGAAFDPSLLDKTAEEKLPSAE
ncbi:MAG: preprotein translocase subunit SecG [Zetaproteobacteria bacterium CG2_30_46_52]|nr:MAG: preprotein translocase subunit SecG [Zetaproteobacteria bacterium CG2_30_46_52]